MSVKRVKIYERSLLTPLLRFATGIDLIYNPHISAASRHFHDRMFQLAIKYDKNKIQENYRFNHTVIKERDLSIRNNVKITYVDETMLSIDYTDISWEDFMIYIKDLNEIIESRRIMQGHDDELDDEV